MLTETAPPRLDDDTDARILRALSADARATLADLSAAVGLSVSAVQARVRRLESRGIITGYRVVVDPEAVGKRIVGDANLYVHGSNVPTIYYGPSNETAHADVENVSLTRVVNSSRIYALAAMNYCGVG